MDEPVSMGISPANHDARLCICMHHQMSERRNRSLDVARRECDWAGESWGGAGLDYETLWRWEVVI
jgi:hypothetical protein